MKTHDISFFSTLEMNNVKKGSSRNLKTIFVHILVRKMIKLWSQLLIFIFQVRSVVVLFLVIVVINSSFIGTPHTSISQIVIISDDIYMK